MDSEGDEDQRTIFCANLHNDVTEELLYELFLQAGPVKRVRIPQNNNYGFVTYQHLCSVDYALEVFKDTVLFGNLLRLKRRQIKNKDDSNNLSNMSYNNVLQTGNNLAHMNNMLQNMMPQNMLHQTFHNSYQNSNYYASNPSYKHERSRSPPRNRNNNYRQDNKYHTPRGRFENNHRSNKRYDHDDKYNNRTKHYDRHYDRHSHKRHKQ